MTYRSKLVKALDHKISNFVAESSDSEEALIAKKIVLAALLVSVLLLIPNTVYMFWIGLTNWFIGGIVFIAFHVLLIIVFWFWPKGVAWIAFSLQLFYILFSFVMVIISGGILYSGGTIFIGLIGGLVFSLILPYKKYAVFLFGLFLLSAVVEALLQPILTPDPDLTPALNLQFFMGHFLVSFIVLFVFLKYFIEKQRQVQAGEKNILYSIMPSPVVRELLETGKVNPTRYEEVSVLFTDFEGFTNIVSSVPAKRLLQELNILFHQFDDIVKEEKLEKIKTIGDGYLAVSGLPKHDAEHAINCIKAAQRMQQYVKDRNKEQAIKWNMRIGIHSGPVIAGIIGKDRFTYDLFGDTVNIASRIETSGEAGRINVSAYTYDLIQNVIPCEYRGKITVKGKGDLDMYFVE